MNTQTTTGLRLCSLAAISALSLMIAGQLAADEPTFSVARQGKIIPINKPEKTSGQTVYLASEVAPQKPTPPKVKAPVAKLTTHTDPPAPVTVIKPLGHAMVAKSSNLPPADATDDPWENEYKNRARIADPIQPVNRGVFWFNHQLYHYGFNPLNKAYKFVFPTPVRTGIANAVNNIEYPVRFVNDLLQWKPEKAGLETEKFLLNSTVGVGGLIKVSNKYPTLAEVKSTDTSATFAKWGIPSGCYIVWPVIGPKSVRDTVGFAGDVALNPASWFTYGIVGGLTGTAALAASAPQTVGNTSDKLDTYETMTKTSIDKYGAVKSAYEQNRKKVESQ
jgi:phospholipid-binding lipoprotein MlaA